MRAQHLEKGANRVKQNIRALIKKETGSEEDSTHVGSQMLSSKPRQKSAGTCYARDVGVRERPQACWRTGSRAEKLILDLPH